MAWNPAQYLKFQGARLRPAIDLINQTRFAFPNPVAVNRILDLGCGPGNLTQHLCEAFPNATVDGVDSSKEMIDQAIINNINNKKCHFRVASIEEEINNCDKKYDLVFSNAALHWCLNHSELFPSIIKNKLNSNSSNNSVLAVQMPDTRTQPSHLLMETAASNCQLSDKIKAVRIPRVENNPSWYYSFISELRTEVDLWSTEYIQQLDGHKDSKHNPVLEFVRSTGLKPILEALGGEESEICQKYLIEYNKLLEHQYPSILQNNNKTITLLPYKRFFLICKI